MDRPLVEPRADFASCIAVRDGAGAHSYGRLAAVSGAMARGLLAPDRDDLSGERVAYLIEPGFEHVAVQWSIWRAGGIAVPLAPSHPAPELAHIVADARPRALVAAAPLRDRAAEAIAGAAAIAEGVAPLAGSPAAVELLTPAELARRGGGEADADASPGDGAAPAMDAAGCAAHKGLPDIDAARPALMVYTSGTTGRPKGVVTTHGNLEAQVAALVGAWGWCEDDRILHVLPLHHVHGLVNALCCALAVGACCEFAPADPAHIWERFADGEITLFMAVPTIYRRLIRQWESAPPDDRERWAAGAAGLRLLVSGSAALPIETLARWEEITGQRLLERYGMTEIGMALSNPLHGERRAGTVGQPLPGVEARIVDDSGAPLPDGEQGEIEVRGEQVFREYWQRPEETGAAFTADGWFRTGDEGVVEDGYWRILGRRSVDIIKTGGFKVSALEIEACLRQSPAVDDAAVVGIADDEWGERVCAAVLARPGSEPSPEELRDWCKERLAPYKVPKQVAVVSRLPRNTMGKVTKAALHPLFFDA